VTAVQLDLFPDLEIRPTIDDRRVGATYLRMCSHCGLLIALFDCGSYRRNSPLGPCPRCGRSDWWQTDLPAGPFHPKETP
jgi:hypothetical protein